MDELPSQIVELLQGLSKDKPEVYDAVQDYAKTMTPKKRKKQ